MKSILRTTVELARTSALAVAIAATVVACGGGTDYGGGGGGGGGSVTSPSAYTITKLVSNGWTSAAVTDTHLKNPWGMAVLPGGSMWVANNHDHSATVYDGNGAVQPVVANITFNAGGSGDVTGVVASSSSTEFTITKATTTAPARFMFATEDGTLLGWSATVDAANAVIAYDDGAGGAQYTGLAIAVAAAGTQLYAADFHGGKIDTFDHAFAKLDGTGKFVDATLPAGFSPFNIQAVPRGGATVLAVAYARRDSSSGDEAPGTGQGVVDIYSTEGALLTRLIPQGAQLNAPWGLAVAPGNFGTLSGALLVGNFGNGRINGFDLTTGTFLHALGDASGNPIVTSGLWGIAFGNGANNQPTNALFVAAGSNGENDGLYARIELAAATSATPTLAQLQSNIFTPRCASCHNGSGASLPGSMNLSSAGATYASLVSVASEEVTSLKRVESGNADASYIVRKLEGTQTVGERMPFGGPYLGQSTIDQVRQWIQAGAAP